MEQVKITYLGHACFCLEYNGWRIVLDPYDDGSVPGLPNVRLEAQSVYCSHEHYDHANRGAVKLCQAQGPAPFTLEELVVPHDAQNGKLRGMSTIRIFTFGSQRVAHMGDLGRMLLPDEVKKLRGVDCMLIPVGGHYTIDSPTAKAVIDELKPRVTIPMHYRTDESGFEIISHIDAFTALFDRVEHCGSEFTLTPETPEQILVMECKR